MTKKVFNSLEEEEKDFQNILNQAAQIKSYQMSLDRQKFDKLPDFYKEGLYNYSSLKNIYKQSYYIKKNTYEIMKSKGIYYLNLKQYENALDEFIKSICIFKYITSSNPNWNKGGGIKDSELTYIEDKGNNEKEYNEIKIMIKKGLLNISLVYLILKDFSNVIKACDEVLKIENNNIKALYRKAKAFIDDPKSLIEQYNEAENLLIKANKLEPNNSEIKKVLEQFSKKLNEDKQKENKIYKKYYNKYNENKILNEDNKKKNINDNNENEKENENGVAQIRMMNLILELCHKEKDEFERNGMKKEVAKYEKIIKQAKKYRDDLSDLINIDFDKPSEKLINFSKKEGFDLKDKNIQKYFHDLKIKLINEINEFHDINLKMMKNKTSINSNTDIKKNKDIKYNKEKTFEEDYIYKKDYKNDIYERNKNRFKEKNSKKHIDNRHINNQINNNNNINMEQFKHTVKLGLSGIFIFLFFYLIKICLGYYLRNKLNIDI